MAYDPDGDPNVDPDNLDDVEAFLNDPTVQALHDDLGREARNLPPEEQIERLAEQLLRFERMRDEMVAEAGGQLSEDDPRDTLRRALNVQVQAFRDRIAELRDQPTG